jgi:hypothetical protein
MSQHTPRSAALLLSEALEHLDRVEPSTAREPIRGMFRAAIERCAISTSLLGQSVNYVLDLAQAIVDTPDRQPA